MNKTPNYPQEMVDAIVEAYEANPCLDTVKELAKEHGKTQRSIVAKLSSLGVYQTQQKTAKNGESIVTKAELVAQIEEYLSNEASQWAGEHEVIKLDTLIKAGKQDLRKIMEVLNNGS